MAIHTFSMKTLSSIVIVIWLLIVGGAFGKNYFNARETRTELAFQTARAFFDQIVLTRQWNARHGGVYVPVTEQTQPNPFLDDPLRDLSTTDGLNLTKVNPAFMTREISEITSREKGVRFHLTSLKPTRPGNRPSNWERKWLESFEQGVAEQGTFIQMEGATSFRYMAPLYTEGSCLKCHAKQGYKLGDIRGGISVILPFFPRVEYLPMVLGYGTAALIGSLIIFMAGHMLARKEEEQQQLIGSLQDALQEIKTLEGIVPICSFCKKIRDDRGFWSQVEAYVQKHTEARFSHGVCPDCKKEHYEDLMNNNKK